MCPDEVFEPNHMSSKAAMLILCRMLRGTSERTKNIKPWMEATDLHVLILVLKSGHEAFAYFYARRLIDGRIDAP